MLCRLVINRVVGFFGLQAFQGSSRDLQGDKYGFYQSCRALGFQGFWIRTRILRSLDSAVFRIFWGFGIDVFCDVCELPVMPKATSTSTATGSSDSTNISRQKIHVRQAQNQEGYQQAVAISQEAVVQHSPLTCMVYLLLALNLLWTLRIALRLGVGDYWRPTEFERP